MSLVIGLDSMVAKMAAVCELLCYVQNYFGKTGKTLICSAIANFYDESEIVEAKNMLHSAVDSLQLATEHDDIPRNKPRKPGDTKRRLDTEDIVTLYEILDRKKISIPEFTAKNLSRIPTIQPSDMDMLKLADTVTNVRAQLASTQAALNSLCDTQSEMSKALSDVTQQLVSVKSDMQLQSETSKALSDVTQQLIVKSDMQPMVSNVTKTSASVPHGIADGSESFVDLFSSIDDGGKWAEVKKNNKKTIRKITGGNTSSGMSVKAAGGEWHVFAGRLDPETTSEAMVDMLKKQNIRVIDCRMLPKTKDWHQRYAAFHISVHINDKDNVFDADVWPYGSDVRDWYFKQR